MLCKCLIPESCVQDLILLLMTSKAKIKLLKDKLFLRGIEQI